jgi:hypothetical protein
MLATVYPPLSAGAPARRRGPAAFPFSEPGLRLTHLGRGAVWLALRALGLGPGRRLAMPAYHCGSEVEAARLAGVEVAFYRVDGSLRVDLDDLALVAESCDATYLISHFGFPPPAPPPGRPAIEDIAHGLFSREGDAPLGSRAGAAVFCPRKSIGVPDGGALLLRGAATERGRTPDAGAPRPPGRAMARSAASLAVGRVALSRFAPLRRAAAAALTRASRADEAARAGDLTEVVIGEWDLEVADMEAAAGRPARLTEWLVRRADAQRIALARRRNYLHLLGELGELCPEPCRELPSGVVPLYLPVLAPDRSAAIARLLALGVRAIEVWPVPHPLLDRERFAELEPARARLLALPVHQALGPDRIDAVLRAAKRALS